MLFPVNALSIRSNSRSTTPPNQLSPSLLALETGGDRFTPSASAPQFAGKTKVKRSPEERQARKDKQLMGAIAYEKIGDVLRAVERGANVNADFISGNSSENHNFPHYPMRLGTTPLRLAIYSSCQDQAEKVEFLLNNGANLPKDLPALLGPASPKTLEVLLKKVDPAVINQPDERGNTLLHNAAWNKERMQIALDHGAGQFINHANNKGETPLHYAVGSQDSVQLLLDHGASIGRANNKGETPLHSAIEDGKLETTELLLQRGAHADINRQDGQGRTPLQRCLESCYISRAEKPVLAKLLLEHGADLALVPENVKANKEYIFRALLTKIVPTLDVPTLIADEKARLGVEKLTDDQEKALQKQVRQTLAVIKKIVSANIPGLDIQPITQQLNAVLARTNQKVADIRQQRGSDQQVRDVLGLARPILHTDLPLDTALLNRYAVQADSADYPKAFEDAVAAGADANAATVAVDCNSMGLHWLFKAKNHPRIDQHSK